MKTKNRVLLIFILSFMIVPQNLHSSNLYPVMDRHLVKEAELIFVGQVIAIQYKSSTPRIRLEPAIPHTFVTCAIKQVLKGQSAGRDVITLRFEGGPSELKPSLVYEVEGIPIFQVGDEGVFYVRKNGNQMCPLVGWQQGFMRLSQGEVYTYEGEELILNDDPLYASRLHPLDIHDYNALSLKLLTPSRSLDKLVSTDLSSETRTLMQDPTNLELIKNLDPKRLTYNLLPDRLREIGSLDRLMPPEWRSIPRGYPQMLMYRDLSLLMTRRNLFSSEAVNSALSPRLITLQWLQMNQAQLSADKILLLNRRVLEDMYPSILTRSLDQTVLKGSPKFLPEHQKWVVAGKEIRAVSSNVTARPDWKPQANPLPTGLHLNADAYLAHIQKMVTQLHTPEELRGLAAVPSLNSQEAFTTQTLIPVQPSAVSQ
ncbi:MAG TPA: hypothetical protein PK360_04320 [bacterium]|nr:hypothetical protein [bacterium]